MDRMQAQHRHIDAALEVGVGGKLCGGDRVGAVTQDGGVERRIVVRAAVHRADVAEGIAAARTLTDDVLEVESRPAQVAQHAALADVNDGQQSLQALRLLRAALRCGQAQPEAVARALQRYSQR